MLIGVGKFATEQKNIDQANKKQKKPALNDEHADWTRRGSGQRRDNDGDDLDEAVSPVFLFAVLGSWSDYLVSSVKSTLIYHQIYP